MRQKLKNSLVNNDYYSSNVKLVEKALVLLLIVVIKLSNLIKTLVVFTCR